MVIVNHQHKVHVTTLGVIQVVKDCLRGMYQGTIHHRLIVMEEEGNGVQLDFKDFHPDNLNLYNATASKLEFGLYSSKLVMYNLTRMESKHNYMKNKRLLTTK
jgi:hypothetical protein